MGTLTADEGFDLHLMDLGDAYAVEIGTEAGADLLQYARTTPATAEDIQRLNGVLSEKWPRFPYRLDFDVSDLPSLLSMSMKSPLWEELDERCLACAACTNVCPTCFCFDVKDEIELDLTSGRSACASGIRASWMSLPRSRAGTTSARAGRCASGTASCARASTS